MSDDKLMRIGCFNHELIHAIKSTHMLRLKGSGDRVNTVDKTVTFLLEYWLNSGDTQQKLHLVNEEFPFEIPGYSTRYDRGLLPGEKPDWISFDNFVTEDESPKLVSVRIPTKFSVKMTGAAPISAIPVSELFASHTPDQQKSVATRFSLRDER
jgi:hypothetical protein